MFKFKFKKLAFAKLYRYYCRKLLEIWWLIMFYALIILVFFCFLWGANFKPDSLQELRKGDWMKKFRSFWLISLVTQLGLLTQVFPQIVSRLTGLETSWGLRMPKKSKTMDTNVLLFTPSVNRETVIFAKLAAIATYFLVLNFLLLTVPIFFFLWFKVGVSALALISFLLINGIIFAVANFLLVVPALFFFYENYSILAVMIFVALFVISAAVYFFAKDFISSSTVLPFLFIPLSVALGSFFFYLYQRDFLRKDLD